ncbi:MAG: zinc-ribbon domain-containing protein, partial [Candidatus Omnitrophota bacterium]|nr:zinc-ribbon domain-containing protein [Candidatus Omnitrophota bacterium]
MRRKVTTSHNLQIINPSLAKEWHPTKNYSLTPQQISPHSGNKVWWLCYKGHEWEAVVNHRSNGTGCPYCSGRRATKDTSLQVVNPILAKEWHPTKNGALAPRDVTSNSSKKVWWICKKGHEWVSTIDNRGQGKGCPYCSNRAVNEDNCLQTINPALSQEWHPNKNGELAPRDIIPGSHRKVWWICKKGHEWEARVNSRARGVGCPYCSNQAVNEDNCLQAINPILAKEWHPTKNGILTPRDVTSGAERKVWWLCKRGHEWKATVSHRSNGTGCPYCNSQTSLIELRIYTEIKSIFHDTKHRENIYGTEADI